MSKMDDIEKHDWRRVAVALAGVVRPLSHEDELRRGWDAAAEKARLAEADAKTELQRAEQYAGKCARLMAEIDDLTARLEAAEAAKAPAVPAAEPDDAGESQQRKINALYADLDALRAKQLDTQARCDKAIQARIEAQRERAAAEKARDELAAMLADVHSQEGAVQALQYEIKFLADRLLSAQKDRDAAIKARADLEAAQKDAQKDAQAKEADPTAGWQERKIRALDSNLGEMHEKQLELLERLDKAEAARDQAIKERDKYRAEMLLGTSEIKSLRLKNKELGDKAEQLRELREGANRARNEARAGLERVQAANAKLAAELAAERAKAGGQ